MLACGAQQRLTLTKYCTVLIQMCGKGLFQSLPVRPRERPGYHTRLYACRHPSLTLPLPTGMSLASIALHPSSDTPNARLSLFNAVSLLSKFCFTWF
jgi:hypothetical protein